MDPVLAVYVGLSALAAVIAVWQFVFSARARARRALKKTRRVPVCEARDGVVAKLVGRLELEGGPLVAPLSKRPCAHFQLKIEQRAGSGSNRYWKTIVAEKETQPFWLVDESGKALIQAIVPKVVLTIDAHRRSGTFNDASADLEALLARHGKSSRGWVFNKTIRYSEGVLEPGESVAVVGLCRREPDPDPQATGGGYRQRPTRLVVCAPEDGDLVITDETKLL